MAKKEKDERALSMQDLRGAMAEEHPERDAGMSAFMAMTSDTVEEQQPDGTYRFALNAVIEDRETTGRLQNEESNEECIDITDEDHDSFVVYVTNCCGIENVLESTDISEISDGISTLIEECDTYTYSGISVDGEVFDSIEQAVQHIGIFGFGTYNIMVTGCEFLMHTLTIVDCFSGSHTFDIPHGELVNINEYMLSYDFQNVIATGYYVEKGGARIFDNMPFGTPLTLEMDEDIVITYICYNKGDRCDIVQWFETEITFFDTGADYIRGVDQYGNIRYYICDDCYVWFHVPNSMRQFIGSVITDVCILSNQGQSEIMMPIDVETNDISSNGATMFVDENDNTFIVVHLNGIEYYESVQIRIGYMRSNVDKYCYFTFYVNEASVIIGNIKFMPDKTILKVSETSFGLTGKNGEEEKGIVGNYYDGKLIIAFVVSDGFGRKYVSKSNDMEINIYHNKKIELIYGEG